MIEFLDAFGNKVELSLAANTFQQKAKHVLVICQYKDHWYLTNHKVRGLEFPGGKVETDESLSDAAHREVYEETGGIIDELLQIAEYRVTDEKDSFVKAVFWGKIKTVDKTNNYHETNGPVAVKGDILQLRFGQEYSFIMKDEVIQECFKQINKLQNEKNSDKF
ncbi:RNA deprotection pyrophosphohydrolase [Neobacillus vireti]|uniref:RNA deprotection pyrophosphohydrolase n=1 Tax=Neobacillus vireti TaxID=220686 RepID=UPI002FFE515B